MHPTVQQYCNNDSDTPQMMSYDANGMMCIGAYTLTFVLQTPTLRNRKMHQIRLTEDQITTSVVYNNCCWQLRVCVWRRAYV